MVERITPHPADCRPIVLTLSMLHHAVAKRNLFSKSGYESRNVHIFLAIKQCHDSSAIHYYKYQVNYLTSRKIFVMLYFLLTKFMLMLGFWASTQFTPWRRALLISESPRMHSVARWRTWSTYMGDMHNVIPMEFPISSKVSLPLTQLCEAHRSAGWTWWDCRLLNS